MKILIILATALLLLVSCGNKQEIPVSKTTSIVESNTTRPYNEVTTIDSGIMYTYEGKKHNEHWKVFVKEFTNTQHPKGYVIIEKVIITSIPKGSTIEDGTTYTFLRNTEKEYIETIHKNLEVSVKQDTTKREVVCLRTDNPNSKKVFDVIRTAEDIYLAYMDTKINPVSTDKVIYFSQKQRGRSTGVIRR